MNKISALGIVAVAISLLLASQAKADTESFTVGYGTEASPLPSPSTTTYVLPTFDTSLGTLTSVELVLSSNDVVDAVVYNLTDGDLSYTSASATVPVTVTAQLLDGLTTTATGTASYGSGIAAPGENPLPGVTVFAQSTADLDSGFADYEGVNGQTYDLMVSSSFGTFGGSGSDLYFGGSAASYGSVEVTYTYTTPDGGMTVALLGLALVGLAGAEILRRKLTAA